MGEEASVVPARDRATKGSPSVLLTGRRAPPQEGALRVGAAGFLFQLKDMSLQPHVLPNWPLTILKFRVSWSVHGAPFCADVHR